MGSVQHAYYTEGSAGLLKKLAVEAARTVGVEIHGNPDVVVRTYDSFGIEDAREMKGLASLTPTHGKKLFVIGAAAMNREAQNALLKLLEEPTAETYFFLLLPHGALLPTLRSRCLHFPLAGDAEEGKKEAESFLSGSYRERSLLVERLLKDKERGEVRAFLDALERALYTEGKGGGGREIGLRDIARMRSYAGDRAPSLKMILEHLAATLPQT